jgi:heptosyltransferase III
VEILLLHPGALGDIILSIPAIALLRRTLPSARVTFAASIDHLALIMSGYADRTLSLSTLPLHRFYSGEALSPEEMDFWKSFDRIVSWTGAGDSEFAKNLRAIHPNACIASWKPRPEESRHVSRLFADSLGLTENDLPPAHIYLDSIMLDEGRRWPHAHGWNGVEPLMALHPGAGSVTKRWPLARFIELARCLVFQEKKKLLIIEGPAEPGLAKQVSKELPASRFIPAESLPLNLLAAILAQCKSFVGNDSGIAHLAAALDLNCTVLFGPTLPQHWAPVGNRVTVLRDAQSCEGCAAGRSMHTCFSNLTVDDVVRVMNN